MSKNNFIEQFKAFLLSLPNSASKVTVKNYVSDINHFLAWFESVNRSDFVPTEVTSEVINYYKNANEQTFSASSMQRHLSSLRKFFKFLKLEGKLSHNPFDAPTVSAEALAKADPWHIKDFKSYLYVFNASHLTIKNYLIDIKQFLRWAEEVLNLSLDNGSSRLEQEVGSSKLENLASTFKRQNPASSFQRLTSKDVLSYINSGLIEEYKQRLVSLGTFSPATINRKLSSLRKYTSWLESEGLISQSAEISNLASQGETLQSYGQDLELKKNEAIQQLTENEKNRQSSIVNRQSYSTFPPFRLFQKITKGINLAVDATLITQLVKIIEKAEYALWKTKGMPVFTEARKLKLETRIPTSIFQLLNPASSFQRRVSKVKNLPKEFYAPLEISTKLFPWYKKAWFNLRYKRPKWYKTYHSYAITHYFHFAVLVIFAAGLAFGFYTAFISQQKSPTLAALPTNPPRILSFQGRLTDNNDNPITTGTNLRFAIYRDLTASGSALQWQEVNRVEPDSDGIFNVILGNNTSIPNQVFFENNALWLGVTVEATSELTPRQQVATVAFAANSETLQGLLPITATAAATSNVVLALNSSGNLVIGGSATPTFQASGGQFTLTGQTLLLNTNSASNGNIQLAPDGTGRIDLTKPLVNTSISNNISTAVGSVEVDDLFSILATSSGQSALTINQTGTGPLISASASGVSKFTVDNSGNITAAGNGAINGTLTLSSSSPLAFTGTTPITITQTNGSTINWTDGTNNLLQIIDNGSNGILNVTGNYQINGVNGASVSNACVNSTGGIITSAGTCPSQPDLYWNQLNGSLFPNNSTVDFLFGSQASVSARFKLTANNFGAGTLGVASISGKTSFASLVVNNDGLGDLFTASSSGTNKFTVKRTGELLAPAYATCTLKTDINGLFTCGVDNNSGVNWWNQLAGALSPIDIQNDFLVGGSATSTAKFSYTGIQSGNTIASISGQLLVYPNNGYGGNASLSAGLVVGANALPIIQTTKNQLLTIGGNTTGNISLIPNNGTGGFVFIGSNTTGVEVTSAGVLRDIDGATLEINDDIQINGNDILDSAGATRITLGATTTLTNTTTTLSGTTTLNGTSLTAINGGATAIDFTEFDVSAADGSITINDGGNAGQVSIE